MSKGTKQFRSGKLIRLIEKMEIVLKTMEESYKRHEDEYSLGKIYQLNQDINTLKSEFNIED